ncbi:hypothetical protein P5673_005430 [Acropora cervicornis]|uniref:Reverse transcriptase domain-containing protein n=1 Tax=Acropora cervicornis TaxID=6130 RepID=A0AAD9QYH4_ACRCE|nr:hypothetical protein P5673_005430 [Acropora cervicornis]
MVITDLLKSFYQIPLAHSSMKYYGVATPFKGIRVYTRSAMGMPGSETYLEELMARVLGDLNQEGCVAKIADDLYVGGNSPVEVLDNWRRVLALLHKNSLRLSAAKTIICPRKAIVLGRKIVWGDELMLTFKSAQRALEDKRTMTIPQPQDALWIVTDGSVKYRGIAATLYVHRHGSILLAGFFSAKLRKHQATWLPCEIEALAIGTFFSLHHSILTYNRVSRYSVHIRHIAGAENLPSDYASRNPQECLDSSCQICEFVVELEGSVVRSLSVSDVLQGSAKMPFTSRATWQGTQLECPHLRRTHSYLIRPSKKATKIIAPRSIGVSFAADVARRHRQLILVLRETVSSYTLTTLIQSEKHEDLRNALIVLCSQLRS